MHFSKKILLTAVACLAPVVGHAAPVTSNPSMSVGDLSFSGFGCSLSGGGVYGTPGSCGQINVNTITSPGMGIQFTSGFFAAPASYTDATLTYHVSSGSGISSIGLGFDGSFFGIAISSVTEKVYNGSTLVASTRVACGSPLLGAHCNQDVNIALNGTYNNLYVEKDVQLTGVLGSAQTSVIDQTFTESSSMTGAPTPTPEPGSIALMGGGLIAVAGLLRRRSALVKK